MSDPFEERTRTLQSRLEEAGVSGAVIFPSPNLYYLTGFWEEPMERHLLFLVPASGEPAFLAPTLYESQLRDETWVESIQTFDDGEDPTTVLQALGADAAMDQGTLLIDPTMWARFTLDLQAAFPDVDLELADSMMAGLRARKDPHELETLEQAGQMADAVMRDVFELSSEAIGKSEADLAGWIRDSLLDRGDEVAFDIVVGSGPNGAKPHHRHGDRVIEPGDPVVLDFGVRTGHYPSDTTRTVVFDGAPPDEFREVHEIVKEAQAAAIDAIEPGIAAAAVDAAARDVIEAAGYGAEFVHRTGHGVGLDVHEDPYIVDGNETHLEPGMVFSVEPGIYLDDEFGVRIEDLVVVTEDGARRLNSSPRDWQI